MRLRFLYYFGIGLMSFAAGNAFFAAIAGLLLLVVANVAIFAVTLLIWLMVRGELSGEEQR